MKINNDIQCHFGFQIQVKEFSSLLIWGKITYFIKYVAVKNFIIHRKYFL